MISLSIDDFIIDKDKTIWVASLSDGTTVYQDDDRPGLEPIAWFRLKKYVYENNLDIIGLKIKFRSHIETILSENERYDGVFFKRGVLAFCGQETRHLYIVGGVKDGIIYSETWKIPEILLEEKENRILEDEPRKCVILNSHLRLMEEKLLPNNT